MVAPQVLAAQLIRILASGDGMGSVRGDVGTSVNVYHYEPSTPPGCVALPARYSYSDWVCAGAPLPAPVSRSDESFGSQLLTYALTPLAVLWGYVVLRPIRIYASLTCFKPGWGTRESVEVTQVRPSTLQALGMSEAAPAISFADQPSLALSAVLPAATQQSIQAMDAARPTPCYLR